LDDPVVRRLRQAPIEVVGRFADASNATLLVRLTDRDPRPLAAIAEDLGREPGLDDLDPADLAVHKPRQGERPLWDFPAGTLHLREVAAYEVATALGWDLVPQTVVRDDGPFGPGSLQRFVPHDPSLHYFSLLEVAEPAVTRQLLQMVVLDLVIDNADRKGGHVLLEADGTGPGRIRLVDHGVTFNVDRKLRTVAWDFAGRPVPADLLAAVAGLCGQLSAALGERLSRLLDEAEVEALRTRITEVGQLHRLPEPTGRYPYPWPLL